MALGIPLLVMHMVLGIVNPAGASVTRREPALLRILSHASPIKWTVRALLCAEMRGMVCRDCAEIARRAIEQTFPSAICEQVFDRSSLRHAPRLGGLALVRSGDPSAFD